MASNCVSPLFKKKCFLNVTLTEEQCRLTRAHDPVLVVFRYLCTISRTNKQRNCWKHIRLIIGTMALNLKKILSALFVIACSAGFLFQSYQVSTVYFMYRTSSRIEKSRMNCHPFPTLVFCVSYLKALKTRKPFQLPPYEYDDLGSYSMREILENTPSSLEVFPECRFPKETGVMGMYNGTECHAYFSVVRKAIWADQICYLMQPLPNLTYSVPDTVSKLYFAFTIYSIAIKDNFIGNFYTTIVYSPEDEETHDWPLNSRRYGGTQVSQGLHQRIAVSKSSAKVYLLPPPFDTHCVNIDVEVCYETCARILLKKINRVPWSNFISDPLDITMISQEDFENSSYSGYIHESLNQCTTDCRSRYPCFLSYSYTYGSSSRNPTTNSTYIAFKTPPKEDEVVTTVPVMTVIEYIVQLCSCLGIWFGLSVFHFNPSKLIKGYEVAPAVTDASQDFQRFIVVRHCHCIPRVHCKCHACEIL